MAGAESRPYPEPKQRELTDEEKRRIRARLESGDSDVYALAIEYACSPSQIAGLKAVRQRHLNSGAIEVGRIDFPDEVPTTTALHEGSVRHVMVNAYERNPEARRRSIAAHGTTCCICGFSFGAEYGPEADGYIHVHLVRQRAFLGVAVLATDDIGDRSAGGLERDRGLPR